MIALIPNTFLQSEFFAVLAAFVAVNTIIYGSLAISKILPRIRINFSKLRGYHRAETRSIYPDDAA